MVAKRSTVLIADDDPQILRLVSRNLQLASYAVLEAADGQQALEQIEAHLPDLVLLDVMMPRLDGITVCERVRQFSAVPIMMLTARGQDEDKIMASISAPTIISASRSTSRSCSRASALCSVDPSTTTTTGMSLGCSPLCMSGI